ncbi:MAG TPA: hypothetical protein VFI27_15140 [candidate division Zixibacteria bacterium]|nr:hypothetical protein [candidate division Zixibacteria bacterium]
MSANVETFTCLNCGRSENQIPLVSLRYRAQKQWICSQCLPILIHKPEQLVDSLAGAEDIDPAPHHDH